MLSADEHTNYSCPQITYRLLTFSNYLQTTYSFFQTSSRLPQFSKDYFHFKTTAIFRTLPDHSQFLNSSQNIPILRLQSTPRLLLFYSYSHPTTILQLIKTTPPPTLIILPDHSIFLNTSKLLKFPEQYSH